MNRDSAGARWSATHRPFHRLAVAPPTNCFGDSLVAVIGDFNDTPERDPLAPLLKDGSSLKDVGAHPSLDDGGCRGAHGNSTKSSRIDYVLLSANLFAKVVKGGYERHGMWGGKNGTLWPHFSELGSSKDAASGHAAVWVELKI